MNLTNDRYLTIAVANWPPANPADRVEDQARALAKAAYGAYDLRATLERVTVTFPQVVSIAPAIHVVDQQRGFEFPSSDLIATAGMDRSMPAPPEKVSLYLLPVGTVPPDLIAAITARLQKRFPMPLTILPALALDAITYDGRRRQAVADNIITAIQRQHAALLRVPETRIIAVTAYDLYTLIEHWQFTFSLRDDDTRIAVVSYARMRPELFGNSPDKLLLESRLRKMITKNVGILCYGLPLSENPRSVLYGSIGGTDELDIMTEDFDPAD